MAKPEQPHRILPSVPEADPIEGSNSSEGAKVIDSLSGQTDNVSDIDRTTFDAGNSGKISADPVALKLGVYCEVEWSDKDRLPLRVSVTWRIGPPSNAPIPAFLYFNSVAEPQKAGNVQMSQSKEAWFTLEDETIDYSATVNVSDSDIRVFSEFYVSSEMVAS